MDNEIPLELGLCWYYENIKEIKTKNVPEDKSHALAFEAGMQIGAAKLKERVIKSIKISNIEWG